MISGVNSKNIISSNAVSEDKKEKKDIFQGYEVKKGETIYGLSKKFNFPSEAEFRKYVKLSGTAALKAGQYLKVPTDKVETTFAAIARKYNMSIEELKKMNPQIKDISRIRKGTPVNVPKRPYAKDVETGVKPENKPVSVQKEIKTTPKQAPSIQKTSTQKIPNSSEIAESLMDAADEYFGAVGREKFDNAFAKINKNNVIGVIEEYDKKYPDESLINTICSEVASRQSTRKNTVMKLYDMLAEKVGSQIATPERREEFQNILNDEFDSWGFVSTKEMDKIINSMIKEYKNPQSLSGNPNKIVILANGKQVKAGELQRQANAVAEENNRPVKRPLPATDKNGKITADVQIYNPTDDGKLSGKTIIVNAGHGGYNPKNGLFDPGTYAEDINGKVIEEWYKNKNFTDKIIPELTSKGAKVIFMSGSAANIMKAKEKYSDADLFLSIHCDSAVSNRDKRGQTIIFKNGNQSSKRLANILENNIERHDWISKKDCKSAADIRNLGVLRAASSMPSVLIETGYQSNPKDLANIDSETFRTEFAKNVTNGIVRYFNQEQMPDISSVEDLSDVEKVTGLSEEYLEALTQMEEVHEEPYRDKNGNLTVGVGHVIKAGERAKYPEGETISEEEIYQLLAKDMYVRVQNVKDMLGDSEYENMPQPLKDAVMDFVFNRGEGTFKTREGLIEALRKGDYASAISKLDVDYSLVKNKQGKTVRRHLSGLNKRRLFEMSHACKIYDGDIPDEVLKSANNVYKRGLYFLKQEAKEDEKIKKAYKNIKAEYNELTDEWFDGKIKLIE